MKPLVLALVVAGLTISLPVRAAEGPSTGLRRAVQGAAGVVFGLGVPALTYAAFTQARTIDGFISGVGAATLAAPFLGTAAVYLAGRWIGADASLGWTIGGGALGLLGGLAIGTPVALLRGDVYRVGLAIWWLGPAIGALAGWELSKVEGAAPFVATTAEGARIAGISGQF